jgi:uncharacterized delta-60 repeat protein
VSRLTSSTVEEAWNTRYNKSVADAAYAIAVDAEGNVYVTGRSDSSGTGSDYATIKYNTSGVEQWAVRYNGPANNDDEAKAIAVDAAGNVYVTGYSIGSGTYRDYATIKYNKSGVEQWVARYNTPANGQDLANAIAVDAEGNVYVTGRSDSSGTGSDYATIKYNTSGVEQWAVRYNGPSNHEDEATAIAVDTAGYVYVTGFSYDWSSVYDYMTIKYNALGVQKWAERYNGPGNKADKAYALVIDNARGVYVTGYSYSSPDAYTDYATIKYDTSGIEQWVSRYNGSGNYKDEARAIAIDPAGNTYVTGYSTGSDNDDDFVTVKYNALGIEQWAARYDGSDNSNDFPQSIALDLAANVYVTGYCYSTDNTSYYTTLKYDSSGSEQWAALYDIFDARAYAIAVDANGNVYVTGESYDSSGNDGWDYTTIKYVERPASVDEMAAGPPAAFSLKQNYPNPFNPLTTIEFSIPATEFITLKIFNLLGQEVGTLVSARLNPGIYKYNWDARGFSSGIYFYGLETKKGLIQYRKLVLLR